VAKRVIDFFKKSSLTAFYKGQAGVFFEELFAPLFATEWGRRASWGTVGLFGLLLIITIIQTSVSWHDDFFITHKHASTNVAHPSDDVMLAISKIPEEHLFGNVGVANGTVPVTSLQLRLVGVIKSEKISRVIISESGQPGKVYSIGDSLPSGITVNSVVDDGVILDNGGHLEKLPLQRKSLTFQGVPKALFDKEE
jgi:type II secretory pathway component PulC